MIYFASIET